MRTLGHNSHGPEIFTCLLCFLGGWGGGMGLAVTVCVFLLLLVCFFFFFFKYKEMREGKKSLPTCFYKKQSSQEKSSLLWQSIYRDWFGTPK